MSTQTRPVFRPSSSTRAGGHTPNSGSGRRRTARRDLKYGLLFSSPWLIGFVAFIGLPIIASAFYSFTSFNLFQAPEFVGLANYTELLGDDRFYKAVFNTFFLALFGVPLGLALALMLALLLNLNVKGQPLYRAVIYLPTIIPTIVVVYVWRWLLNAQYGFINEAIAAFGLDRPLWLDDPMWTKPAILIIGFWTIGGTAVIYLAALKEVPAELHEAAKMDGAGPLLRFRHIVWPAITPVTLFQVVVSLIAYLQMFTQPYLLAQEGRNDVGAGPDDSMLTYAMYVYQNAFVYLKMGYASALAWVLFLLILILTFIILKSSKRWVHYGN
ncbi:sugar ABC transporter permease [Diaminobutyricimonas sp. TR449]|uniref:carbohydrate ABC transporter permease n=1 Tax=Diaminobutyricimonas sp. TR449 TaxID=2708076 RepID=UPI0014213742|nr:sugar ABC transporter permease [Diaminobutyricimonas sp. TR449]